MSANYQRPGDEVSDVNGISRISAGSVIKGEITSPNDIRIDGSFEGRICSQAKVIVGDKAVIKGDIICNVAELWGRIDGNFFVKDTLSLKESCVVNGDLHIRRLQVDLDAQFNGNCSMITEEEFNQLTSGSQPAMYDVHSSSAKDEDEFKVSSPSSPFSIPTDEVIPEA